MGSSASANVNDNASVLDAYMYVNVSPEFILKYAKEIQIANKLITRMTTTR